jgi:hypothetical protein
MLLPASAADLAGCTVSDATTEAAGADCALLATTTAAGEVGAALLGTATPSLLLLLLP